MADTQIAKATCCLPRLGIPQSQIVTVVTPWEKNTSFSHSRPRSTYNGLTRLQIEFIGFSTDLTSKKYGSNLGSATTWDPWDGRSELVLLGAASQ